MRVRCKYVDTFYYENESITVGKEYEVLHENGRSYCIVDDHGKQEYHFKVRFEIIKEDKMEEVKVGDKVVTKDVVSITSEKETFVVARILVDTQTNEKVLIPEDGSCLSYIEESKVIKKPLRTIEEVIAEMRTKEIQFTFNGDNWYVKHVASYNKYYVSYDCHDNIIGTIYLDKETAAKYCIELNEILKGGK